MSRTSPAEVSLTFVTIYSPAAKTVVLISAVLSSTNISLLIFWKRDATHKMTKTLV